MRTHRIILCTYILRTYGIIIAYIRNNIVYVQIIAYVLNMLFFFCKNGMFGFVKRQRNWYLESYYEYNK